MGRWKPTCHTIELKRASLNIHVSRAIWSTRVFSSFLQNTLSKVIFFLDILMEGFLLQKQKVSNIPFPWGRGSASLPLCSLEVPSITLPGVDWTLFKRLTCLCHSGLQIPQVPHHVTYEDVPSSLAAVPRLPCGLGGIPLQLWAFEHDALQRTRTKWATVTMCALRQQRCILSICKMMEMPVMVP